MEIIVKLLITTISLALGYFYGKSSALSSMNWRIKEEKENGDAKVRFRDKLNDSLHAELELRKTENQLLKDKITILENISTSGNKEGMNG